MRIYSKYHDYFDSVVPFDKEGHVWVRKTVEKKITYNKYDQTFKGDFSQRSEKFLSEALDELPLVYNKIVYSNSISIDPDLHDVTAILGFCGKLYPIILLGKTFVIVKSFRCVNKFIEARRKFKDRRDIVSSYIFDTRMPFTNKGFSEWQSKFSTPKGIDDLFIEFDSPVFIIENVNRTQTKLIINPCLKDFKIQSIIDPWTAYQEIDMYLGNVLTNRENANLERSQELIRDSKGFDNWSFKQKGPKKRKRK